MKTKKIKVLTDMKKITVENSKKKSKSRKAGNRN